MASISRPLPVPMNALSSSFRPYSRFALARFGSPRCPSFSPWVTHNLVCCKRAAVADGAARARVRAGSRSLQSQLREDWLSSLSCPFPYGGGGADSDAELVLGIDPDASGALALLRADASGCSAQVFDTPHLQVFVGKRVRKRLDARSIIQLLRSFGAPLGTTAYIEQSIPFPQDGKQGWWSGGFTYGLWVGILVASGFSVVPVPSNLWKNYFELSRNSSSKDDSRKAASVLFPELASSLKRKKDHGRAEALLIAAYGKRLILQSEPDVVFN